MSDELVNSVADLLIADPATFASLPVVLAHRIFLALPVDSRGRASCVCRAWRDVLAEPSLWSRLDLSVVRVEYQRRNSVLRGAASRACGQLCQLELWRDVALDVLRPVLTANAGSLRGLHLHAVEANDRDPYAVTIKAIMAAAPLLQVLKAEYVGCSWEEAPLVLRAEPPFAQLQMLHTLAVDFYARGFGGMECFGPFAVAVADAALQPALLRVGVRRADTRQPVVMDALVDAALARRLRELSLKSCTPPAAAPLARLLAEGSLTALGIDGASEERYGPLFDAAGAALVADALRENTTLTKLVLDHAGLCHDVGVAGTLLGALVGHPSLRELGTTGEDTTLGPHNASTVGAALAALIAADAPALQVLDCSMNSTFRDAGLAPIVAALPLNRHLHKLDFHSNGMSEAFAREQLLPAVRANTSLRVLRCANYYHERGAAEAEALVRRRGQHD